MKINATKITVILILIILIIVGVFFVVRGTNLNKYKNMDLTLTDGFTVTAHTGCMGTEENSIDAMEIGVDNGADIIEFDVHFDKNGYPVLSHDEPRGGELKLDAAFEFLSKHKNIRANVDMKSVANMKLVQDLALEYDVVDQIFYTGIKDEFVEAVKTNSPLIPYYLNVDVDKKENRDEAYLDSLVGKVKNAGAIGINFKYKNASEELVAHFHKNDLLVSIWTVDKEYYMYKIICMKPDNITTRRPDLLHKISETYR